MRAGMDTIRIHLPEKYLRNDHNTLYIRVQRVLDDRQIHSAEVRNAVNPLEIKLKPNLIDGYTGDVYLTLDTLEGFKFFFTVKSEGPSLQVSKIQLLSTKNNHRRTYTGPVFFLQNKRRIYISNNENKYNYWRTLLC